MVHVRFRVKEGLRVPDHPLIVTFILVVILLLDVVEVHAFTTACTFRGIPRFSSLLAPRVSSGFDGVFRLCPSILMMSALTGLTLFRVSFLSFFPGPFGAHR